MRTSLFHALLGLGLGLAALPACATEDAKGDESELPDFGKDDSFQRPTEHGYIFFGLPDTSELTPTAKFHAWNFDLSGDASLDIATSYALRGQRRTDTVLYLYKQTPTGWGPYIARNDDDGDSVYSRLRKNLGAGTYRVIVKGYAADTKGKFKLSLACDGAGCAPPAPTGCVFGSAYYEIVDNPAIEINNKVKIYPATLSTLSAEDQAHLVVAVQQSSHTDVTTAAEALSRVDQEEMNVVWMTETAARRTFIAFEYGAGDNSYGAIFDKYTGAMVTNIHDGDLESCETPAETCLLPEDYSALRADANFALKTDRSITAANQLNAAETAQVLAALRRTYGASLASVTAGLSNVDDNKLNYRTYTYSPTSAPLTVVEFGAGDTSVGMVFHGATLDVAGVIEDLFIYGCSLFAD